MTIKIRMWKSDAEEVLSQLGTTSHIEEMTVTDTEFIRFANEPQVLVTVEFLDGSLGVAQQFIKLVEHAIRLNELGQPKCQACSGRGWLLGDKSNYGLRIKRCDACKKFESDRQAVTHVAQVAAKTEGKS